MATLEDFKRDVERILGTGVNHTATVMELLKDCGWTNDQIVPVIYQLLLHGKVDPNGNRTPYKAN